MESIQRVRSDRCGLGKEDCTIGLQTDPICPRWWLCVFVKFRDLGLSTIALKLSSKRYLRATMITLANYSMKAEPDSADLTLILTSHSS